MKKGFTLVEIIAVVTVLGVLAVIGTVAVNTILKESREKGYNLQVRYIEKGAKEWANKNVLILPDEDGATITLTLLALKQEGFVDANIKNPKTDKYFPNDMLITITREGSGYAYNVLTNTGSVGVTSYYNPYAPVIALVGNSEVAIKVDELSTSNYDDPGVIAKNYNGTVISDVAVVITANGEMVDSIPLNKTGDYVISYTAKYSSYQSTISRKVRIVP